MDRENVYIRLRHRVKVTEGTTVTIGDVATVLSETKQDEILKLPLHTVRQADKDVVIIDVMNVIGTIQRIYEHIDIQTVGPTETIVTIAQPKRKWTPVFFVFIWILLFIGAGLAIMNFHEDVSMNEVHRTIFYFVTGEKTSKPLLLQIPYSLGLGIGMILFFNHFFTKRFTNEPSPLEIEMFQYQETLDKYITRHDNPLEKSNDVH